MQGPAGGQNQLAGLVEARLRAAEHVQGPVHHAHHGDHGEPGVRLKRFLPDVADRDARNVSSFPTLKNGTPKNKMITLVT